LTDLLTIRPARIVDADHLMRRGWPYVCGYGHEGPAYCHALWLTKASSVHRHPEPGHQQRVWSPM